MRNFFAALLLTLAACTPATAQELPGKFSPVWLVENGYEYVESQGYVVYAYGNVPIPGGRICLGLDDFVVRAEQEGMRLVVRPTPFFRNGQSGTILVIADGPTTDSYSEGWVAAEEQLINREVCLNSVVPGIRVGEPV